VWVPELSKSIFDLAKLLITAETLSTEPWPNYASSENLIYKVWDEAKSILRKRKEVADNVPVGTYKERAEFRQELDVTSKAVVSQIPSNI
jgi:hypothetical protein